MSDLITVESLKVDLFKEQYKQLTAFMWDEGNARKFLGAVAYCFQAVPKLADCEKWTLIQAFMKMAELGLFPSTVSGEAYILPYYNGTTKRLEAQFQLGYKGIITLLYRAGITSVYSDIARENDKFEVRWGTDPGIIHNYALSKRGKPIGGYVVVTINGEKIFKYMGEDEILKFKEFSKSKDAKSSPWDPKNDPELNMWKKTVIKQISKTLPQTEQLSKAIAYDNEDGDIKEFVRNQIKEKAAQETGFKMESLMPKEPGAPEAPEEKTDAQLQAEYEATRNKSTTTNQPTTDGN